MPTTFDLTADRAENFEIYRGMIGDLFSVSRPDDARGNFAALVEAQSDGTLFTHRGRHSASRFERDAARIRRDRIDDICIMFVHHGSITAHTAGFRQSHGAGSVLFLDRAKPVMLDLTDCRFQLINGARDVFGRFAGDTDLHGRSSFLPSVAAMADAAGKRAFEPEEGENDRAQQLDTMFEYLVASVCRPAAGGDYLRPGAVQRVMQIVDRHIEQPELSVAFLARATGMSRAALYRTFAGSTGLATFVRWRRLEEAHRLLMSVPRRSVSEVALSVGFENFSHFATAFKAYFGCSPSAVAGGGAYTLDPAARMQRWKAFNEA